ncbi:hypothetical protein [Sorangium sp. So ce128]|uniref:hypothetical protein n=1 Tax=Sorangium sp. So ce128 TaxID=3133281 RepID=UPI003F6086FF
MKRSRPREREVALRIHALEGCDPGARRWVSPGAGARLAVRVVGPLRFETGIDPDFPLTRYRLQLQAHEEPAFEPVIAGALLGGAGIAF